MLPYMILLCFLRLALWPSLWYALLNIPCGLFKRVIILWLLGTCSVCAGLVNLVIHLFQSSLSFLASMMGKKESIN